MDGSTPLTEGGDACLSEAALAALAGGTASESEESKYSAHLDGCERCRKRLEQALGTIVPEGETPLRGDATQTFDRDAPVSPPPPPMGGRTKIPRSIGPYRIVQVLGEGGFGMVYEAIQEEPIRRRVALKVLKAGMDSRAVLSRFEAERQALALMDHPNIAKIIDAGQTERGRPYFVMERVQGVAITDYIQSNRLALSDRIALFTDVCYAVQHAHQKGVIHRDLKPSNVLVSLVDGAPVPKIIDFGIAKALSTPLSSQTLFTMQGQLIGTPEYMSPEQAEVTGLDIDTRADVYSLGVMLYELLTGALPFERDRFRQAGIEGIQRLIRESEPPKPSTRLSTLKDEPYIEPGDETPPELKTPTRRPDLDALAKQLRGELDWIVLKCLEKDRTRRYASVVGLAEDLQRYLDDEPVLARPPSKTYRAKKFMRKHRTGVAVAAGLVVTLVLGLVGTTLGLVKATRAEKLAAERYEVMDQLRGQAAEQRDAAEQAGREVAALAEGLKRQAYAANIHAASITLGVTPLPEPGQLDRLPPDAVAAARGYLERCPPELRGWEWRLLAGVVDRSLRVDSGQANVADVAIDPSGNLVAAADLAGFVTLRDLETGDRRGRIPAHLMGLGATGLAFTPDGQGLLTCSWGQPEVIEWDTQTLSEKRRFGSKARGLVCVDRSPDGRLVAAGTTTGQLLLWDTTVEQPAATVIPAHGEAWVRDVTFSPDGSVVATAGKDGRVRLWSVPNANLVHDWAVLPTPDPEALESASVATESIEAHAVAFSVDGELVAAAGTAGRLHVWSVRTGQPLASLEGHIRQTVSTLSFVGNDLWSTGKDGGLTRWIASDNAGAPIWREGPTSLGHTESVTALAVSPDGRLAVTGSDDRTCRLWDLDPPMAIPGERLGRGPIVRLDLPGLSQAAAVGLPRAGDAGRALIAWSDGRSKPIALTTIDLGPDRSVLATSRLPFGRSWDFMWWHPLVRSVDGRFAAIPNRTVRIPLIEFGESGQVMGVDAFQPDDEVWHDLDFAPDGTGLAVGHAGGYVTLWEPGGTTIRHRIQGHDPRFRVQCVRYSPDGGVVASAGEDGRVLLWSARTAEPVGELPVQGEEVAVMAFNPAGDLLVTADLVGTIRLWDWRTATLRRSITEAHDRIVSALAFTADGRRLLSTGKVDRALRVWDLESGENLFQIEALPAPAWDVEVAGPEDAVLVTLESGPPLLLSPRPFEATP